MWGLEAPRHRPHSPEIHIPTFLSALPQTPGDFQEDRVLVGLSFGQSRVSVTDLYVILQKRVGVSSRGRYDPGGESHLPWPGDPRLCS